MPLLQDIPDIEGFKKSVLDEAEQKILCHPLFEHEAKPFQKVLRSLKFNNIKALYSHVLNRLVKTENLSLNLYSIGLLFPELFTKIKLSHREEKELIVIVRNMMGVYVLAVIQHAPEYAQSMYQGYADLKQEMEMFGIESPITNEHLQFLAKHFPKDSRGLTFIKSTPNKIQFNSKLTLDQTQKVKAFMRQFFKEGRNNVELLFTEVENSGKLELNVKTETFSYFFGELSAKEVIINNNPYKICEAGILTKYGKPLKNLKQNYQNSKQRNSFREIDTFLSQFVFTEKKVVYHKLNSR